MLPPNIRICADARARFNRQLSQDLVGRIVQDNARREFAICRLIPVTFFGLAIGPHLECRAEARVRDELDFELDQDDIRTKEEHMLKSIAIKTRFSGIFEDAPGAARAPLGPALADTCLGGGLRLATLHEVFPAEANEGAASGFALTLAVRALVRHKWLLWVRQDFSALEHGEIHAAGLLDMGIDPERVLMFCAPDAMAALRAGAEGISCKGMGAVIIEAWGKTRVFDLTASRRLTLAARQHGVTVIVLRFGAGPEPSAAETRWLVKSAASPPGSDDWGMPAFDAALVRNRHGACGRWIMEWDCRNGVFRQAHPRALAAAPSDRSFASAVEGLRQAG